MKFIHAADLHLDSPMVGLSNYDHAPLERLRSATREAFEALVDLALTESIDCLLIAGDIYDGAWRDFGTGLFFREQIVRLTQSAIRVFVIHGNHDALSVVVKTLPQVDGMHVFSANAAETVIVTELGIAVHGQSFATPSVTTDLAAQYPDAVDGLFNIGLLHTSLTGREPHDPYAPSSVETLCARGYDYFALGHVHTREIVREVEPRIVFPGNLQGRHARETGPHGCDVITVEDGVITDTRFVELDVLRWHVLPLDISGITTVEALSQQFIEQVRERIPVDERLHAIRVQLTGATPLSAIEASHPGTLRASLEAALQDVIELDLWLEKTVMSLHSLVQREELAGRDDAVGEIVRCVDDLLSDELRLAEWFAAQLNVIKSLPDGTAEEDPARYTPERMRDTLLSAEATVLSKLAESSS